MCMPISPMLWVIKSGAHDEKKLERRNEKSHDVNCDSIFLMFTACFIYEYNYFYCTAT